MKKTTILFLTIASLARLSYGDILPNPNDEQVFASSNYTSRTSGYVDVRVWPKTAPEAIRVLEYDKYFPVFTSVYLTNLVKHTDVDNTDQAVHLMLREDTTMQELLDIIGESMNFKNNMFLGDKRKLLEDLQHKCFKKIRMHLRSQGVSFVTKNGVNPCAQYLKDLNATLNAPRLAGLQEWLASIGETCTVDVSLIPSDEILNEKKAIFLSGEEIITPYWRDMLRYGLGLEEYNKFVREYNGDAL